MPLSLEPAELSRRLRQRLTRAELFALAFALGMVGVFVWLASTGIPNPYTDFGFYLNAARGKFLDYYYGYWYLPLFAGLSRLPLTVSYVLWSVANLSGVFLAARVWRGSAALAIISYQMFYSLFYGQIVGLVVGGLALCWCGLVYKKWDLAGLGIVLASGKFQLGLTGSLLLVLLSDLTWRQRLRVWLLPVGVGLLSLWVYPGWPLQLLERLQSHPPDDTGSIALWRWVGPLALVLWLPPLLLPLPRARRFVALAATMALALPYFQQTDLLLLLTLPIGWVGLLGNLGYLFVVYQWSALQMLALLPLVVYVMILAPAIRAGWQALASSRPKPKE